MSSRVDNLKKTNEQKIMGDWDARVGNGQSMSLDCLGQFGEDERNRNGLRRIEFYRGKRYKNRDGVNKIRTGINNEIEGCKNRNQPRTWHHPQISVRWRSYGETATEEEKTIHQS